MTRLEIIMRLATSIAIIFTTISPLTTPSYARQANQNKPTTSLPIEMPHRSVSPGENAHPFPLLRPSNQSGLPYSEDFESYSVGGEAGEWYDSGVGNSLAQDDSLFKIFEVNGNQVMGTSSTGTNIHSHYIAVGSENLSNYEYSGRMQISDADGGIGVTLLSDYPNSDAYYRLRRYAGNDFHYDPHGTSLTGGSLDTGVVPQANVWYRFKIEVEDSGSESQIRAKVWQAKPNLNGRCKNFTGSRWLLVKTKKLPSILM